VPSCTGKGGGWPGPTHVTLHRLQEGHGLRWLRASMPRRRSADTHETLQGGLGAKVMRGVESAGSMDRPCNCDNASETGGQCCHSGDCRRSCLVRQVACSECPMVCTGVTQRTSKRSVGRHPQEACKHVDLGEGPDSLAGHAASHSNGASAVTVRDTREEASVETAWEGDVVSRMETSGTDKCELCMEGHATTLRLEWEGPGKVTDSSSELSGVRRRDMRPHRSLATGDIAAESTDDAVSAERVEGV